MLPLLWYDSSLCLHHGHQLCGSNGRSPNQLNRMQNELRMTSITTKIWTTTSGTLIRTTPCRQAKAKTRKESNLRLLTALIDASTDVTTQDCTSGRNSILRLEST